MALRLFVQQNEELPKYLLQFISKHPQKPTSTGPLAVLHLVILRTTGDNGREWGQLRLGHCSSEASLK